MEVAEGASSGPDRAAAVASKAASASQDEAEESDATEEEATGGRTTRVGRPRGGMKVAARIGRRGTAKGDRKRQTTKG